MQPEVIFSIEATEDLESIFEYIAKDLPFYAARVTDDLYEHTQILLDHPQSGRIVPEHQKSSVREVFQHS